MNRTQIVGALAVAVGLGIAATQIVVPLPSQPIFAIGLLIVIFGALAIADEAV